MTDNGNKNKNPIKDLSNNKVLKTIYKKNQLLLKNDANDNNNPYKHNKLKFNMNRNRTYHYNIKDTLDLYDANKDYSKKRTRTQFNACKYIEVQCCARRYIHFD